MDNIFRSKYGSSVVLHDVRIVVRGQKHTRGKRKRAHYVLLYKSNLMAIIEAKDNNHSVGHGFGKGKANRWLHNTML